MEKRLLLVVGVTSVLAVAFLVAFVVTLLARPAAHTDGEPTHITFILDLPFNYTLSTINGLLYCACIIDKACRVSLLTGRAK